MKRFVGFPGDPEKKERKASSFNVTSSTPKYAAQKNQWDNDAARSKKAE